MAEGEAGWEEKGGEGKGKGRGFGGGGLGLLQDPAARRATDNGDSQEAVFEHAKVTIRKEVCTAMSHLRKVPRAGFRRAV